MFNLKVDFSNVGSNWLCSYKYHEQKFKKVKFCIIEKQNKMHHMKNYTATFIW